MGSLHLFIPRIPSRGSPLLPPQGPKGEAGRDGEMVSIQGTSEAWGPIHSGARKPLSCSRPAVGNRWARPPVLLPREGARSPRHCLRSDTKQPWTGASGLEEAAHPCLLPSGAWCRPLCSEDEGDTQKQPPVSRLILSRLLLQGLKGPPGPKVSALHSLSPPCPLPRAWEGWPPPPPAGHLFLSFFACWGVGGAGKLGSAPKEKGLPCLLPHLRNTP